MKSPWVNSMLIFLMGFFLLGNTDRPGNPSKKHFQIEESSKLFLKGTSNVNTFNCDCGDRYYQQTLEADYNEGGYARFRNADLVLSSSKFNCHNRKIDMDMAKALKADQYPYIKVSLVDTWQDTRCLNNGACKDWFDVKANVNVTITNVTRQEFLTAKAKQLGPNRFQLRGEKDLQMSTFGVDPPEAMFGMIKVNDWISFHFDLIVTVDEVQ